MNDFFSAPAFLAFLAIVVIMVIGVILVDAWLDNRAWKKRRISDAKRKAMRRQAFRAILDNPRRSGDFYHWLRSR